MGFPAADIAHCGPVVLGHGADPRAVHAAVQALHDEVVERRGAFALDLLEPDAARAACAVASGRAQMLDLELLRFLGIEPAAMKLVIVKSSVHLRAAFAPVASHVLVAKARGPMAADPADLPWTKLPPTIARRP